MKGMNLSMRGFAFGPACMKLAVLAGATLLTAFAARAEVEEDEVTWRRWVRLSTEANVYSAYIWRGQILVDTPCWQPAQNVFLNLGEDAAYGAVKGRLWGNFTMFRTQGPHHFAGMSIVDETISYVKSFDNGLDLETGFILYQFPTRRDETIRDTEEFLAGARWRNPWITPRFYVWWDFAESGHNGTDQLYFDFDFTHDFKILENLTVRPGFGFGIGNDTYMASYSRDVVRSTAFNNFHGDIVADYRVCDHFSVGCSLSYYFNLSRHVRDSPYLVSGDFDSGILRGGIHLKVDW